MYMEKSEQNSMMNNQELYQQQNKQTITGPSKQEIFREIEQTLNPQQRELVELVRKRNEKMNQQNPEQTQ